MYTNTDAFLEGVTCGLVSALLLFLFLVAVNYIAACIEVFKVKSKQ